MNAAILIDGDTGEIVAPVTAETINEAHRLAISCRDSSVTYAIECGRLLVEKKKQVGHGKFKVWITDNCEFSYESAKPYMVVFRKSQKGSALPFSSIRAALGLDIESTRKKRRKEIAELVTMSGISSGQHDLYLKPCLDALDMEAESFDWVITDPPYPKEFLPVYADLARACDHVLKPGGSLLCMIGQSYLPDIIAALSSTLSYHWTLAYLTPGGQATQIFPRKVNTFWKPVLWFTKGEYAGDWIGDVTRSDVNDNDKTKHHWGQSESGMRDLMKRFVKRGDSVFDPFMGAGTTGVIALELGAKFTGFDIDEHSFNEAAVRMDNAKLVA